MDPRERADAILARARARGAFVVTPESAISPMDASATLQIPRAVVNALDDTEVTMVFPVATEELPAIAQDAATQSLAAPPRRAQHPVDPRSRPTEQLPQARPEQVDGLVPTTRPSPQPRQTFTQRLDG
ncbi:hypothetical protein [Alloactinosynnema sp. L-07]|uniref:hypothetical protein n=1 Tax=Alloactinosynnema sp. L-07 TaxID=1653480 RepID=UPI00065EF96A|nr:hypothetical protein [Alloactinosynnema sp. L-07]CRK59737.1 hypothetical protein [Alloactinosynnema sp. L-07]